MQRAVRFWWVLAVAALVAGAITTATAQGFPIVAFELAATHRSASNVLAGFDVGVVHTTILWDFLFLALYAPALFLGSLWAGSLYRSERLRTFAMPVAIGALVAGGLDIVENLSMLAYLDIAPRWDGFPLLATVVAVPKFLLIFVAIGFILGGVVAVVRAWTAPGDRSARPRR